LFWVSHPDWIGTIIQSRLNHHFTIGDHIFEISEFPCAGVTSCWPQYEAASGCGRRNRLFDLLPGLFRISGLELAWKVTRGAGDPRFTKGDLTVIPLASRTYAVGQNIFVYYEIYNLERTAFGQTHYKVEYTVRPRTGATLGNVIARLIQTITGKKSEEIRVGYEQAGQAQSERAYVELEIPRREKGRHVLSVTVTDLVRSAGASEEVVFQIE